MDFMIVLSGSSLVAKCTLLVLCLPLLGSLGVWLISLYGQTIPGNGWRNGRDSIIWGSCGATLLGLLMLFPYRGCEFILLGAGGVGYSFVLDGLRLSLAILTAALWLCAAVFSRWHLSQSGHKMRFYFFFLLAECGLLSVLLSADFYTMLTGFVVLNIAFWVLTGHRESEAARLAAGRMLAGTIIGDLCALLGVILLFSQLGTVRFAALKVLATANSNHTILYLAGGLLLAGISLSCAIWPLPHRLPSITHTPGPAAALMSGAVTVAWLFSVMVLSAQLFLWNATWGRFLVVLGTLLLILAAVTALGSRHLKLTLTLLAISQTGLILLTLGLNGLLVNHNQTAAAAVVLECLHHGLCQLLLFLCVGAVCRHQSDLSLASVAGFGRGKKALLASFVLGSASLCGLPLFFGSVNTLLLQQSLRECLQQLPADSPYRLLFQSIPVLVVLANGICAAALLKVIVCLFVRTNRYPAVQAQYDRLTERGITKSVQVLLFGIACLLLVGGLTAPYTLDFLAYNCVGFFSTRLNFTVTAFQWQAFVLGALHLGIGVVLYLLFWHNRLKKMSEPLPEDQP